MVLIEESINLLVVVVVAGLEISFFSLLLLHTNYSPHHVQGRDRRDLCNPRVVGPSEPQTHTSQTTIATSPPTSILTALTSHFPSPQSTPNAMFGFLRPTQPLSGGLLWYHPPPLLLTPVPASTKTQLTNQRTNHRKIPWRMSSMQKYRQRQRLRRVDRIVECVDNALAKQGMTAAAVERWKMEMPTEAEMEPRDKYTLFDRNAKKYRKGVHSEWPYFPFFSFLNWGVWRW